jgi:hypothetical protein
MYWKELHDSVEVALGQYIANLRFTDRQTMAFLSEAQSVFQRESKILELIGTITVPAGTSVLAYPFRWEPVQWNVHDDTNRIEYGIRDYDQWRQAVDVLTPNTFPNGRTQPSQPDGIFPTDHIVCFQSRQLYVYPTPTTDIILTVRYKPLLTTISQADPAWSDWFTNSAAFGTQFTTTTPEREFWNYLGTGFVEYAVEKYMLGISWDKTAMQRLRIAQEKWQAELSRAKSLKRLGVRQAAPKYVGPTSA